MSIPEEYFESQIKLLEEHFDHSFAGDTGETRFALYYAYCCTHLTAEQFTMAVQTIFVEDDRFPKPKRFVEAAQANLDEQALSEWVLLTVAAQQFTRIQMGELTLHDLCPVLTGHARFALESIGGLFVLADADSVKLGFVRRDFIAAYKAYQSPTTQAVHADRLLNGGVPALAIAPAPPLPPTLEQMPLEHQEAFQQTIADVRAKYPVEPYRKRIEDAQGEMPDQEYFQDFELFQKFAGEYKKALGFQPDEAAMAMADMRQLAQTAHPAVARMVAQWLGEQTEEKRGDMPAQFSHLLKSL